MWLTQAINSKFKDFEDAIQNMELQQIKELTKLAYSKTADRYQMA